MGASAPPDQDAPDRTGGAGRPGWSGRLLIAAALLAVAVALPVGATLLERRTPAPEPAPRAAPAASASVQTYPPGRAAPALRLRTLDGGRFDLAALRGRPVVVNFWATWCGPCVTEFPVLRKAESAHRELPLLRQTSAAHRTERLAVVGVLFQDQPAAARAFVRRYGGTWPVGIDTDGRAAARWGVTVGLPHTFFVRADGTLASHQLGELTQAALERQLAAIFR